MSPVVIRPVGAEFQVWFEMEPQRFPIGTTFDTLEEAQWYKHALEVALDRFRREFPVEDSEE